MPRSTISFLRRAGANLCVVIALCAVAPSTSHAQNFDVTGTAYERLDLSTPEAALSTFLTAFHQGDFVTAFLVFSPEAQNEWYTLYSVSDMDTVLARSATERLSAAQTKAMTPAHPWEQWDFSYMFAHIMNWAKQNRTLPLNLEGLPSTITPTSLKPLMQRQRETSQGTVLAVTLKAYPQQLQFVMQRSPLGKWRLAQVIFPGGDTSVRPWAIPRK